MSDLRRLLEAARSAGPGERIGFRDSIAAQGVLAIPTLLEWIADPRLGAFAVRTLEKIAGEPAHQTAVVHALSSVDPTTVPEPIGRDVSDALTRLTGRARRSVIEPRRPPGTTVATWPGPRNVSALELRFHDDMVDIFRLAGEATRRIRPDGSTQRGYWASYFLRGVRNHGGPAYARQLLRQQGTTEGFQRLKEEGRLDLTVESLVLRPEYLALFTDDDRRIAAHRLADAGYGPPQPA